MKTKTGIALLFCLGFFYTSLFAQQIIGPDILCYGDFAEVYVFDNGQQVNEDFTWDVGGLTFVGPTLLIDGFQFGPGAYQVSVFGADGTNIGTYTFIIEDCGFIIEGPPVACTEECAYYTTYGINGNPIFDITWEWTGPGLATLEEDGIGSVLFCPMTPGTYVLVAFSNGGSVSELAIEVLEGGGTPDIISISGGFCSTDSLSNCDRVCENTTVTYTTPLSNPNTVVNWTVSGAESFTENGNELVVEWGDPGQGQVSVSVGETRQNLFVSCSVYNNAGLNAENGTALVNIQGDTPDGYAIDVSGPFGDYSLSGTNNFNVLNNLGAGTYFITVTDANGVSQSCSFTIFEEDISICEPFAAYIQVSYDPDDCCGYTIRASVYGQAVFPATYTWSNGSTVRDLTNSCPGTYEVIITDSNGCTASTSITIEPCELGCTGTNSICVDILETPEAAFETNPPAVNGVVEICEGQTVFFENQTNGGFNYTWDFGDGISSSLTDVEHTYSSPGTYEAMLIARNDCFCGDTASVTIIVEQAITPEIDCAGTICPGEEITYTSNADCSTFYWSISANGTIISGGNTNDNFITVDWGEGPEGIIELSVDDCNGDYCLQSLFENIPIIDDNAEIEGPSRVCKGAEVIYTMPAYAGTEFVWTVTSFGEITEGQGTNEITVKWADAVTPVQQQVRVTYESCYLGCGGEAVLDVRILNEIFIEGPVLTCPDAPATYICQTPLGANVNADWLVYDNTGTVVASSGAPTSSYTLDWDFGSGDYRVEAVVQFASTYCIDNFSVFVEVVNPTAPPVMIDGPLEVCPGISYNYTGNSSSDDFDYTWYITDGGNNYVLNGKSVNIIWGSAPPYQLDLTQTNLDGFSCESASISVTAELINSVDIAGPAFTCDEVVEVYTATDYANQDYEWRIIPSDAGSIVGGEDTDEVEIQWHMPGTFDIEVEACGVTNTYPVTVYPKPEPVPVFDKVCPNQTGLVTLTEAYVAYEWLDEFGVSIGNGATANLGTGYYEVIVTDNNGCTENEAFFIGTYGKPDVTISTPDFGTFCLAGGSMTLYALETSSGPLDYQWFFNGTAFGTNSSAQVISEEGSYYVEVTDINGCTDISNILNLACSTLPSGPPNPGCIPDGYPDFEILQGTYCNESRYTNTSVNDVPGNYDWDFIDIIDGSIGGSNLENPMYTWDNAGFNLVVFTAGIASIPPGQVCPITTFKFDTIPVAANFVFEGICTGETINFFDLSTFIPQTSITGWSWDFGDPLSGIDNTSSAQNPQHTYNVGGNYTVTLTITDLSGCLSVRQKNVQIVDPPLAAFDIPAVSCEGASVSFGASGDFTDVFWDFGDPASGAANESEVAPTYHVYESPGVYTVTLTVENIYGCSQTVTQNITIDPNNLSGTITANPGLRVCAGDSVRLTAPPADTYLWSTGATSQEITVLEAETYEVTIYDALGCGYTPPSVVIDIIPIPQAQITAVEYNEFDQPTEYFYDTYETCYGENVFLEITENINYTYEWPDGESTTTLEFTDEKDNLLAVGTHIFNVDITDVTTGCTNVAGPFVVIVHPVPENIVITSMPSAPVCENTPTVFSVDSPDPTYTYVWNTGETGTSITTFYAGEYFVRAINPFGCEGQSNSLEITPGPNVDLIPSGCHARCNPDTICLPPITGLSSFQWYFNGAPIPPPAGNDLDYIATESGEYYVEMISVDGCTTISDILTLDLYDGFGSIQGLVYFDLNENGVIDAMDTLMSDIPIILQNGGTNLDTLVSNQNGSIAFNNILSTDYNLMVDTLNLGNGLQAIIQAANASLVGCDDEDEVEFLIQYVCTDISEALTLATCPGEAVDYNGTMLNVGDVQDFTFNTLIGCDSLVTVTVEALAESTSTLTLEACTGTTVDYDGTALSIGTTTDFTFDNASGCDSIVTVAVMELMESTSTLALTTCIGTTVDYNGTALSGGTTTDFVFDNVAGCDSTVTVSVTETQQDSSSFQLEACSGSSANYNGTSLAAGTQTDFLFTSSGGCDSIVTVIVEALNNNTETVNLQACSGASVFYNNENLLAGTTTVYNLFNANNCDSTVTVIVEELFESTESIQLETCENTTVDYNGTALSGGTITDFTFTNTAGCDSVVTVNVTSLVTDAETLNMAACTGNTVMYDGTTLAPGTTTNFTFTNSGGCDSIVTVEVEELALYEDELDLVACEGATVDYGGVALAAGSETEFMYTSVGGCDSIITVKIEALLATASIMEVSACEGESYDYNGNPLAAGTSTDFILTNAAGCDSTLTINVAPLSLTETVVDLKVCTGESILYNGFELIEGFEDLIILTDQHGCDSTIVMSVAAYADFDFEVYAEETCWNNNDGMVFIENLNGGTAPFVYSIDGVNYQDSTTFTALGAGAVEVYVLDANGCEKVYETNVDAIGNLEHLVTVPEIPCDYTAVPLRLDRVSTDDEPINYLWEDGSTEAFMMVDTPGVYTVEISNACETRIEEYAVEMTEGKSLRNFFAPNVFTPNGDGTNDFWKLEVPATAELLSFDLRVFDRWGNHLKTFAGTDDHWDGTFNGSEMNPGVYVFWYRATVINCGERSEIFRYGNITLVR